MYGRAVSTDHAPWDIHSEAVFDFEPRLPTFPAIKAQLGVSAAKLTNPQRRILQE